jgi:hypothetical protein
MSYLLITIFKEKARAKILTMTVGDPLTSTLA